MERRSRMTLWEQAEEAQRLGAEELGRIVRECQLRIEAGVASAEDYLRFIACKLELTQRTQEEGGYSERC